jgi:hypothetical protein
MKPPPRGPKNREITPLSKILPQVSRDLDLDSKVGEMALLSLWTTVVGGPLSARTRATRLLKRNGTNVLQVRVKDAATAGELSFLIDTLVSRLNSFAPQTGCRVAGIDLKIGTLSG